MKSVLSRRQFIQSGVAASSIAGVSHIRGVQKTASAPRVGARLAERIRMYVFVTNETDATLRLKSESVELEWGEFTPGWTPPRVIRPGDRLGFEGEGDLAGLVPWTGTEGSVRYHIDAPDGGELYIHWNSPVVESQYGNTFHIWAPPGWEVTHSGGQGHEATLEIRLRRTARRSVPNFHPDGRGFAFDNHWNEDLPAVYLGQVWNALLDHFPVSPDPLGIARVPDDAFGPITHANAGLCGGMVYAVMDYYANHLLPPTQNTSPSSPDDPLFQFIRDRLWDSFDVEGEGHRFLGYSSPHYPNGDEGIFQAVGLTRGRSWITYREAFPQIQADIDAGMLSPIGLIQTDSLDIGKNHQVLAYAYEKSGQDVTLYIYDPNAGQSEETFRFNIAATDGEVHIERSFDNDKRIWCLFRINGYVPRMPPGGRQITSVTEAIRATTDQDRRFSVRTALAGNENAGSITDWLRSL